MRFEDKLLYPGVKWIRELQYFQFQENTTENNTTDNSSARIEADYLEALENMKRAESS
ncbi:MAG: hypothetical protein R2744_09010 [Bacteroidales bacterium]